MQELQCDMWELARDLQNSGLPPPLIFITTNGYVKLNGDAVMGRGCAQEARDMFPGVEVHLGHSITSRGNSVDYLGTYHINNYDYRLFSFPVKHHWRERADLALIKKSCIEASIIVKRLASTEENIDIIIPRPGCGNGNRDWETEVKPIVKTYLNYENVFITYT